MLDIGLGDDQVLRRIKPCRNVHIHIPMYITDNAAQLLVTAGCTTLLWMFLCPDSMHAYNYNACVAWLLAPALPWLALCSMPVGTRVRWTHGCASYGPHCVPSSHFHQA